MSAHVTHFDSRLFATTIGMPSNMAENLNHAIEKCRKHSYFYNSLICLTCKDGVPFCLQCIAILHNGHKVGSKEYYAIVSDDAAQSAGDSSRTNLEVIELGDTACEVLGVDDNHISKKAKTVSENVATQHPPNASSLIDTASPAVKTNAATKKNTLFPASESELQKLRNSCFVVFVYSYIDKPRIDQMMLGIGCVRRLDSNNDSQFLLSFMMKPKRGSDDEDNNDDCGGGDILDCLYVKQEEEELCDQKVIDKATILGVNIKFRKGTSCLRHHIALSLRFLFQCCVVCLFVCLYPTY